jgi:hypothetical protein
VAQVIEYLPSKCEALSSKTSAAKTKQNKSTREHLLALLFCLISTVTYKDYVFAFKTSASPLLLKLHLNFNIYLNSSPTDAKNRMFTHPWNTV